MTASRSRLLRAAPATCQAAERNAAQAGRVKLATMGVTTVDALETARATNAAVLAEAEALDRLLARDIAKARREAKADAKEARAVARNNAAIMAGRVGA